MPGGGGEGGMGGMEQMLARDPAINRYVDDKYQPLAPDRLRGALKSTTPEDALLAVAKRMPVRLRLIVDQRKLNVLLAKCGNSKLPLEVRQVRINRPAAPAGFGGGGMGGMGGEGGMPGGGGFAGGCPSTRLVANMVACYLVFWPGEHGTGPFFRHAARFSQGYQGSV